jgi:uncharacterized short protein YbdD (DUF466 family)
MSEQASNKEGNDMGSITVGLPDWRRHLDRMRRTNPDAAPLISTLIEQLRNFDRDPDAFRPKILKTIDRIEARPLNAQET